MTARGVDSATFDLSTDELPEWNGTAYSPELAGHMILTLEPERVPSQPLPTTFTIHVLPGLVIASGVTARPHSLRASGLRAVGNLPLPPASVATSLDGQPDREAALRRGDATLASDRVSLAFPRKARYANLSLPCDGLKRISRDSQALQLLRGYVKLLDEAPALATTELRHLVGTHVRDLMALVIGTTRDAHAKVETRVVRAARLSAIKADIAARLGEPELTVSAVAERQRISVRYVQMLFETEGTTFSQFVLRQRLMRAHLLLSDLSYAGRTINAIALEAGFGDLSHFNRDFRRLYAASPSSVRAAALRRDRR
jgi:AraC-like DNA-binding protein